MADPPKETVAVKGKAPGAIGEGLTVTICVPVIVAPFLTTETNPVVPFPAKPSICVGDTTVNAVTGVPPMLTEVAPVKLVPVIVKVPELAQTVKGATLVMV